MTKIIILKLTGIKYTGNPIGDDIRVELEVLGNFIGVNKKIQKGDDIKMNQEIGQFISDESSMDLKIGIKVIERDLIFNDVGSEKIKMEIDLANSSSKREAYEIKVRESKGISFSDSVAIFHITLESFVTQATQYVAEEGDGWLRMQLTEDKSIKSIPAHLAVQIYHIDPKREYFMVMEGALRGQKASVKRKPDGSSYLLTVKLHMDAIHAVYSISKKTITVKGKTYLTKDYPSVPWIKGIYDIEIPDFPHRGGLNYSNVKHAITWFRVGHDGDRYIHAGSNFLGCMTVIEHDRWNELYSMLIKARKGDSASIGTLKIID